MLPQPLCLAKAFPELSEVTNHQPVSHLRVCQQASDALEVREEAERTDKRSDGGKVLLRENA